MLRSLSFCHRPFLGSLFDPAVLRQVQAEVKEDTSVLANVALAKVVSLPTFGSNRASRKASSGTPGSDQQQGPSSSSPLDVGPRGRGKGAPRGNPLPSKDRGQKRHASPSPARKGKGSDVKPKGKQSPKGRKNFRP